MINLPDALAPSMIAAGFFRENNLFYIDEEASLDGTNVEFNESSVDDDWWMVVIVDNELRCEAKVDSITQALRILWTFRLIELVEVSEVHVGAETPLPTP